MRVILLAALAFVLASNLAAMALAEERAAELDRTKFQTLLRKYCFECHDDATAEAKLSLESLSTKTEDFARWVPVYDKLRLDQMPPKDEPQPAGEERRQMMQWLGRELHEASLQKQRTEGRVVLRRLNVTTYETSLRDLLGKQVAVRELLPEDTVRSGFDNVSEVLDVSAVHLLRYQDAAEKALQTVVPRHAPKKIKTRLTGREVVAKAKDAPVGVSLRIDGDTLLVYASTYNHIPLGTATVPQPGRYVVRASLYAVNNNGQPLPVRLSAGKPWGRESNHVLAVRDAPADKPRVIEQEVELGLNDLVDVHAWTLPTQRQWADRKLNQGKQLDQYVGPGLAIEWLEIEGPLDAFPAAGYGHLFGDLPLTSRYAGDQLRVDSADPRADAERLIRAFLPVAFRRPVGAELQDYYVQFVLAELDKKRSFEEAMLIGYRAVLCSPHFLFLTEPLGTRPDQPAALDDFAVAARLSYFLWSTLPDRELTERAAKGELTKPEVLRAQVERLLKDPRSQRFTEDFAGQWLDLKKINDTTPDPNAYAEFDDFLFWSMPQETSRFFEEVLEHDRSLTDFTHSDWTFLNERLAQHYGVPDVFGGEMRLVKLPPDAHRGGVLTHASILKVTADGAKTSPVLRGKWVLDRILGQPPAPPPANVSAIEPDIRGTTTIRQQLEKHRSIESCAACHRHIDPPGFALESFDPIGSWREFYRGPVYKREALVKLANYPAREVVQGLDVEKGGVTAEGRSFKNIDEYKQILLADKDQLARNLAEKLLIYATGAEIQFADREVVEQLVARSRANGYGFRSLIHDVVQSRIFLHK
jgi:hypothetical protein